jgi:phosphoribosylformimino-5-aminoimidazole carboxamide ribotide isomerase
MRIVPVIDVRGGQVVRATGGDRSDYAPLESELCPTGEPLPLAFALRERFGCTEVYVADLDAIAGRPPDLELVESLLELELAPWVDAGVRDAPDALRLRRAGAAVVVGSETVEGPAAWDRVVQTVDPRRLAFSLDLRDGRPVAPHWPQPDAEQLIAEVMRIASEVRSDGPARLVVLDLGRVGGRTGVGTEALLARLTRQYPDCEVFAGGGIRGDDELARLERLGVAGALVSTALHEGRLQPRSHS